MAMMRPAFEGENVDYPKAHRHALRERVINNPHTLIDADVARYLSNTTLEIVTRLILDDLQQDPLLIEIHELLVERGQPISTWTETGVPINPNLKPISDRLEYIGYQFVADNGNFIYSGNIDDIIINMLDDGEFDESDELRRLKDRLKRNVTGRWDNTVQLINSVGYEVRIEKCE